MNDQQDHLSSDHTDRMPSLLTIFKAVRHNEIERIVENLLCKIKSDAVLGKVASSFFRVPFELQSITAAYKYVCTIS